MGSVVAQRYAEALYQVAFSEKKEDTVLEQLKETSKIFVEYPQILQIFSAPFIPKVERLATVKTVFSGMLCQDTLNFLMLITEKGRISEFNAILSAYIDIYNKAHNIVAAVVTSAVSLDESTLSKLSQKLSEVTGKTVELTCKVDASILGGLIIDMAGERMDSSVASRIDDIAKGIKQFIA